MMETKIARKVGAPPTATRILRTLYRLGQVMGDLLAAEVSIFLLDLRKIPSACSVIRLPQRDHH